MSYEKYLCRIVSKNADEIDKMRAFYQFPRNGAFFEIYRDYRASTSRRIRWETEENF